MTVALLTKRSKFNRSSMSHVSIWGKKINFAYREGWNLTRYLLNFKNKAPTKSLHKWINTCVNHDSVAKTMWPRASQSQNLQQGCHSDISNGSIKRFASWFEMNRAWRNQRMSSTTQIYRLYISESLSIDFDIMHFHSYCMIFWCTCHSQC